MRSETLSSKQTGLSHVWFYPTLFVHNLKRFWPVWSIYLALWMLLPLSMISRNSQALFGRNFDTGVYILESIYPGLILAACWGLFSAMAVFSYLHNTRAAGMIHALPVRREGLFLTNWLSGLSFLLGPQIILLPFLILAESVCGQVTPLHLLLWFLVNSFTALFFYSFAVFCAMFTGNLLALPIFYGILNFLVLFLYGLVQQLFRSLVYGAVSSTNNLYNAVAYFSPFVKLTTKLQVVYTPEPGAGPLLGLQYTILYAAVGLVMTVFSLLLYRRRALESAGNVVSVPWARPIFKYGVAVCSALFFGPIFFNFLSNSASSYLGAGMVSVWRLLPYLLFFGLVGYFTAEMLLHKSFRVFSQGRPGAVVLSLGIFLLCGVFHWDLMGFEHRIPASDAVAQVEILPNNVAPYDSGSNSPILLTDPADIASAMDLHRSLIEKRPPKGKEIKDSFTSVNINYILKDGTHMFRNYPIILGDDLEQLDDPASPASLLTAFLNRPSTVMSTYFGFLPEDAELYHAQLTNYGASQESDFWSRQEELDSLLSAIYKDISEGQLGRRFLADTHERMDLCYYNDLILTFRCHDDQTGKTDSLDVCITLQTTADDTLAVLRDLGCSVNLVTWAE